MREVINERITEPGKELWPRIDWKVLIPTTYIIVDWTRK